MDFIKEAISDLTVPPIARETRFTLITPARLTLSVFRPDKRRSTEVLFGMLGAKLKQMRTTYGENNGTRDGRNLMHEHNRNLTFENQRTGNGTRHFLGTT